jgi:hypothetical protein
MGNAQNAKYTRMSRGKAFDVGIVAQQKKVGKKGEMAEGTAPAVSSGKLTSLA